MSLKTLTKIISSILKRRIFINIFISGGKNARLLEKWIPVNIKYMALDKSTGGMDLYITTTFFNSPRMNILSCHMHFQ